MVCGMRLTRGLRISVKDQGEDKKYLPSNDRLR
jgi:hypothetical protein